MLDDAVLRNIGNNRIVICCNNHSVAINSTLNTTKENKIVITTFPYLQFLIVC